MREDRIFRLAAGLTCLCGALSICQPSTLHAQEAGGAKDGGQATAAKVQDLIAEVRDLELALDLRMNGSKLMRMKRAVSRVSVTNARVAELIQYGPTEFELIGLQPGETGLTFWFGEEPTSPVLRYLVRVLPDLSIVRARRANYAELQAMIGEQFPGSQVQIYPLAGKVIVRGQARDIEEAAEIMTILRPPGRSSPGYRTLP